MLLVIVAAAAAVALALALALALARALGTYAIALALGLALDVALDPALNKHISIANLATRTKWAKAIARALAIANPRATTNTTSDWVGVVWLAPV